MDYPHPYLTCRRVRFYALKDEDAFFEWIKKIDCIASFEGAGPELYLDLKATRLSNDDFHELLALFDRYKIDMTQFQPLLTEENKQWLAGSGSYWHKRIYTTKKIKNPR